MRLRIDNQSGFLGAPVDAGGATVTFASPPGFRTLTPPDYYALELEPGTTRFEIVYLVGFTAGSSTGVVMRGMEGTSAVAHGGGVAWSHSPTAFDFLGTELFPAKQAGAVGNGVVLYDASMTSGSNVLTSLAAAFTAADVGKSIGVVGAGPNASWGGLPNGTTISSFTDSHHVNLSNNASVNVTNAVSVYGTDDYSSLQAALNAAKAAGGGRVTVAAGIYVTTKKLIVHANCSLVGLSRHATQVYLVGNFDTGVIQMGTGNAPFETDIEVQSLTVGMVGPNQRNGSAFGIGIQASRFTLNDVEVSIPAKTGTLAALNAGATSASYTAVIGAAPAPGEILLMDQGGFSEVRGITSVSGSGPYTVSWGAGLAYAHGATAVAQSLNYSSPCLGILAPANVSVTTAQIGPGVIEDCVVRNTIADAFYTANSDGLTIIDCEVCVSGDDAISCHSASVLGPQQTDTSIIGCLIQHAGGAGVSVLGGLRTVVVGNTVYGSFGAGINLSAGQGWQVLDTCVVEGNVLRDCGIELQPSYTVGKGGAPAPQVVCGGIDGSFGSSNSLFTHVRVVDNQIENFKGGGILFFSTDGTASLDVVEVAGNTIDGWNSAALTTGQNAPPSLAGIYVERSLSSSSQLTIEGNAIRLTGAEGVKIASTVAALVEVSDNALASLNQSGASSLAAISCQNTGVSVVTGNELGGSLANLTNFADMNGAGTGSAIWGNSDGGLDTVNFTGGAFSSIPVGNGHMRWYGTGAPLSSMGIDGDYYERADGSTGTHLYFRSSGSWSAVA